MRCRFSFSVYFALAKGLPAQVCFSFGQVGPPWLRHVLFRTRKFWAPSEKIPSDDFLVESTDVQVKWMHFVASVDADPKSLHDVMFYATVARTLTEIMRSAQPADYAEPHMRSLIVDGIKVGDVEVAAELDAKSQSEVESGKHLRCRWRK